MISKLADYEGNLLQYEIYGGSDTDNYIKDKGELQRSKFSAQSTKNIRRNKQTNDEVINDLMLKSTKSVRPTIGARLNISYGERLYRKGLAIIKKNKLKTQTIKQENNSKEMRECTFKPKLMQSSIYIYLQNKSEYSKNIKTVKKEQSSASLNKVSVSKSTATKKSNEEMIKLSHKLYDHAERIRQNKHKLTEDYYTQICSFTPKINNPEKPNIVDFFFRLQKWVDKRNEKYDIELDKAFYDQNTNARLFQPHINDVKRETKDVHSNLYLDSNKRIQKENYIKELVNNEIKTMSNLSHINNSSKDLLDGMIKKIAAKIFDSVTHEECLNATNINLISLPDKILKILCDLFNEIKDSNEVLNKDEFSLVFRQIYNLMSVDQKNIILEWYFSKPKPIEKKKIPKYKSNYKKTEINKVENTNDLKSKLDAYMTSRNKIDSKNGSKISSSSKTGDSKFFNYVYERLKK